MTNVDNVIRRLLKTLFEADSSTTNEVSEEQLGLLINTFFEWNAKVSTTLEETSLQKAPEKTEQFPTAYADKAQGELDYILNSQNERKTELLRKLDKFIDEYIQERDHEIAEMALIYAENYLKRHRRFAGSL